MRPANARIDASDGTALGYHVAGAGPPLVLVHGAASDARQWDRVVPLLAPDFTVVAMDRRGRGSSGPIRPDHSLEVEYDDVATVARSAGDPVCLVGHSSGARFALHAALRVPDLAGLVLYEPPPPETLPPGVLESLAQREAAGDREGILEVFLRDVAGNDEQALALIRGRPIWPIMMDNALTLPAELRAARRYRFDPAAFAALAAPATCLVGGDSGPEMRRAADEVARALPAAEVRVLAGQGHGAMLSAPGLFAEEVRRLCGTGA
ncbi:MAG: alpha/beta fold hydrolase [Acidimicrobiales bacterium]